MHWVIGVVAIIALPAVSLATRTGGLAFTMFSGSGSYRLRVVTIDSAGRERRVPPTALAAHVRGSIGDVLAGSEGWRFAPFGSLIRRRLDQVASLACETIPQSRQAHVTLEERRTLDAPIRTTTATSTCR
jgi:phage baseplate assembly protein W